MFKRNKKRRKVHRIDTLIGQHTELHGGVQFSGGLHIDGKVRGNVVAAGEADATVTVSENGTIEGEVRVPHVVINGTVVGDVYATDRVELAPRARVTGNVYYGMIEMAIGAEVNGNLVHQGGQPEPLALRHDPEGNGGL
jgi:cytoskeletal protein CcmA (bactofilin family)